MRDLTSFYIDGEWVRPGGRKTLEVINPATEEPFAEIALGTEDDVNAAVAAAKRAFETYSQTSREERLELFARILDAYKKRYADVAEAIMLEMGAPKKLAQGSQAGSGLGHFATMAKILKDYPFEEECDGYTAVREPVGVCALITPWNWPVNQIACKVAPALAAGCTMVLKPSEVAPVSAHVLAEILDEAGVPKGVFNRVNGTGPEVGAVMSRHKDVDMVSFTGSTRAGVEVAKNAAPGVKRVSQELGGKSPNIILDDADLDKAVRYGVKAVMQNTGQSCNAPTRMFVPAAKMDDALRIAKEAAEAVQVGAPDSDETEMGPLVSEIQWNKVQGLIQKGIEEGAELVTGGTGRPAGLNKGYYAKPTVFGRVSNDMTIAREEIFGPVLAVLPYTTEDEAIRLANDTDYGLAGYVYSGDIAHARKVAKRIRAGNIHLNGASATLTTPFGGYKQSGNGREWGEAGLDEFLETKALSEPN